MTTIALNHRCVNLYQKSGLAGILFDIDGLHIIVVRRRLLSCCLDAGTATAVYVTKEANLPIRISGL